MATLQFHPLQISHIEPITRDAVALTFTVPAHLADTFAYAAGQYLTLRTTLDGEELRRSYSICAAVQDQCLRVAIKRVAGGVFSNWAAEHLRVGSQVDVMPPQGQFSVPHLAHPRHSPHLADPSDSSDPSLPPAAPRQVLAFAAGSGITPVLSILKSTLLAEPQTCVTLVYGNRSSSAAMFRQELADLKDSYLGRCNLVWIMSREPQDIPLFNGRIDYAKCHQLLTHWIDPARMDAALICGPQDMVQAVSQALQEQGMDTSRIKAELFGTTAHSTARRAAPPVQPGGGQCEVAVVIDGTRRSFVMQKNQHNLVDAGLAAGLELPYSCKGGVCSTCRARVVQGEVDMDNNFALEDYEVARGFVLCCQSYPVTDTLVIDFDQDHAAHHAPLLAPA